MRITTTVSIVAVTAAKLHPAGLVGMQVVIEVCVRLTVIISCNRAKTNQRTVRMVSLVGQCQSSNPNISEGDDIQLFITTTWEQCLTFWALFPNDSCLKYHFTLLRLISVAPFAFTNTTRQSRFDRFSRCDVSIYMYRSDESKSQGR